MTVIKIGGTSGSGKSTLVRGIFSISKFVDKRYGERGKVLVNEYRYKRVPLYILGSYENVCGGMDGISDKEERLRLIKQYIDKPGITIFEGLIVGGTYGEIGALSEAQKGAWLYAFMGTPYEECVKRVLKRRKAAGNDKPFDPEKTLKGKLRACESVAARAHTEGHHIHWVNHLLKPEESAKHLLDAALKLKAHE